MKGEVISEKTSDIYFWQRFFFLQEKLSLLALNEAAPDSYHLTYMNMKCKLLFKNLMSVLGLIKF